MTVGMITYTDQERISSHHDGWDRECGMNPKNLDESLHLVYVGSYEQNMTLQESPSKINALSN